MQPSIENRSYSSANATRTICITSGKGGVGKTTLTVNLGIAIAKSGRRVLLLDGDLGLANVNVQLGVIPKLTINDVVKGTHRMSEVIRSTNFGIDIIPGASGIAALANLGETERAVLLSEMEALQGYDVMLIDTAAGIGENVLRFVLASDDIVVVTTPEPTALADAYGIIKTVLVQGPRRIRLLVNRARTLEHAKQVADHLSQVTARFTGTPLEVLAFVPLDPLIERSIYQQKPHLITNSGSRSAQMIRKAAERLVLPDGSRQSSGVGAFFQRLLNAIPGWAS